MDGEVRVPHSRQFVRNNLGGWVCEVVRSMKLAIRCAVNHSTTRRNSWEAVAVFMQLCNLPCPRNLDRKNMQIEREEIRRNKYRVGLRSCEDGRM